MSITKEMAKHLREVNFGGNWTGVNLKDQLKDVDWKLATQQIGSMNTIAILVYHINYYLDAAVKVLDGGPLDSKDEYSFSHPPIESEEDWQNLVQRSYDQAENLAQKLESLNDHQMSQTFVEEKYGSYFRNFQGIIEHSHYHLGQIVLLKKLILSKS